MVLAKSLTKKYFERTLFDKVDFVIGKNRKIALVGRNGVGKTTLFKLIMGEEERTGGTITIEGESIEYIPQELIFPDAKVFDYLEKNLKTETEKYKIDELMAKVEFVNYNPNQPIKTLSEGQKMKLKLVESMLRNPTLLMIDEPTNHLDIEGIMWFEDYLRNLPISSLFISHDRSFINHVADEVWEIEKEQVFKFVGDYDNYKEEKLRLINKWDEEYVRFVRKKAQLEKLLESARKIKGGKKRGKAVGAAKKRIAREVESDKKEKFEIKTIKKLAFDTEASSGKLMLRFKGVAKNYGDHPVFEGLDFELRGAEKVWLFGPNGGGKSTLVKIIVGDEKATAGDVQVGSNIKIGYFSQIQTDLEFQEDLLSYFVKETGTYFGDAYSKLSRFLFDKDAVKKKIWQLSPGERARFKLAIFANKNYDFLILDEPDNHLDIETKEVLEQSLRDFKGTLLLVSHDRYFVESIGMEKMLNLKDGKLTYL